MFVLIPLEGDVSISTEILVSGVGIKTFLLRNVQLILLPIFQNNMF